MINIYDYVIRGLLNTKLKNDFLFREYLPISAVEMMELAYV
jgi:hypothetical protein